MRSLLHSLSVPRGEPVIWVGLGCWGGGRLGLLLRGVVKCVRERREAYCRVPRAPQPSGPAWVRAARGSGGRRDEASDRGGGGRARRRGASCSSLGPRGPSRAAGTLAQPGRARGAPGGAGGRSGTRAAAAAERGHPERKEGGSEGGRGTGADRKWGKKVQAGGRPGPGAAGAGARRGRAGRRRRPSRGRRGRRRRGERVWGAAAGRVAAAGARGALCVRALPLPEEDGPEGKVGVTRAAPGGSAGAAAASPTERRPGRPGGAQSGCLRRSRGARPLTAGGRGCPGSRLPGARAGARGSPAEGWAAPPASTSRRAA